MSDNKSTSDANPSDKDLTLNHIDKLYSTLSRVWDSMDRIMLTQIILSIIVTSISSGIISLEEAIDISGLKFKISLTVILVAGVLIIAGLFASFFSQYRHADKIRDEIKDLYKSIGYTRPALAEEHTDAFEIPSVYITIFAPSMSKRQSKSKLFNWYSTIVSFIAVLGIMFIIPIGAQIVAALKISALYGWSWWVLTSFAVLIVLTILSVVFIAYEE